VLEESSIGAIVTHGDPDGLADNTLVGTDFIYRNTDFRDGNALSGTAWFQRSFTEGFDSHQMAYGGTLDYPNDIVNWKLGFRGIEENFKPKLGFVNREGIRQYDGEYRYRIRREGWLRTFDTKVAGILVTDYSNAIESSLLTITPLTISTNIDDRIEFIYEHFVERPDEDFDIPGLTIPAGSYQWDRASVMLETSRNRQLRAIFNVGGGTFYDGYSTYIAPEFEWRPSRHWLILLHYEYNFIRLPHGDSQTHLVRLRLNIQFTPDLSWISLVQYDNNSDSIGINTRIRWIIQDGREFFLVFNQGLDVSDGIRSTKSEPLIKGLWTIRF